MNQLIFNRFLKDKEKNNSISYKVISLLVGVIIFLIVLPGIFILLGLYIKDNIWEGVIKIFEMIISILAITAGSFFLVWATVTQWKTGKITADTDDSSPHLIINGPYKYCRNPLELGAILYYLGIGTLIGGIIVGAISFFSGLIVESIYSIFFEEKRLEKLYGEEYKKYRERTPFIFPGIIGRE